MVSNIVILRGRATATPTLRQTTSGKSVTDVRIAVQGRKNASGERMATYITVDFWGKLAETICNHILKGDELYIQGELRANKRTTQDGREFNELRVVGQEVSFGQKGREHREKDAEELSEDVF